MRKLFALLLAFTVDLKKTAAAINAETEAAHQKTKTLQQTITEE